MLIHYSIGLANNTQVNHISIAYGSVELQIVKATFYATKSTGRDGKLFYQTVFEGIKLEPI